MMPAIAFTLADRDNLELVRQVVLNRLRSDREWNHFDYSWERRRVEQYVLFDGNGTRDRFVTLSNEIMWQLLVQGVITAGMNNANPNLPWFRITDYGRRVLDSERFIPHDPTGYLDGVREIGNRTLSTVAMSYLEESLHCYTSGRHVASIFLLGVAAEAVFLELCNAIDLALSSDNERARFKKCKWVKQKHRWVVDKYRNLSGSVQGVLPESLDTTLGSLYDLIRQQRNEVGHPQAAMPNIDRELAFVFFRLFPTYLRDVEEFSNYCSRNSI